MPARSKSGTAPRTPRPLPSPPGRGRAATPPPPPRTLRARPPAVNGRDGGGRSCLGAVGLGSACGSAPGGLGCCGGGEAREGKMAAPALKAASNRPGAFCAAIACLAPGSECRLAALAGRAVSQEACLGPCLSSVGLNEQPGPPQLRRALGAVGVQSKAGGGSVSHLA